VDEAVSNIIEHSYGEETDAPVECTFRLTKDALALIFHDHGVPFDPASVSEPDIHADLQARTTGGLGIYMMRQVMDKVEFKFGESTGNTLTMVKFRDGS
jgi:anti-sigma regulatory factor (Ser/Thr protein kinase)